MEMNTKISRREALARTGLLAGAALFASKFGAAPAAAQSAAPAPATGAAPATFRFCLNTSTIRGQKLGIVKEIEIASQAGYSAIEPWVEAVNAYTKSGGTLADLRKRIADAGLTVEDAIAFSEWIVDDDARRARGLEQARRDMDTVAQIGGKRIAAPPSGATNGPKPEFARVVERYRALLELGDKMGIIPQFEIWGHSANYNRLGECVWVAMETGHPSACVLADVFHLYKGGSNFSGLRLVGAQTIQMLHMNDYPSDPPRERINDGFRVYPGEGIAPWPQIMRDLRQAAGTKILSLELFSQKYWSEDAMTVAKTGLDKMKAVAAL